jgi:DNA-binding CsgD family transcriptional regulator
VLVGRETERNALDGLLAGARVGTSGVLVVAGEPGIGKTALLQEATTLARAMRVLRAQGTESEQQVPFAGLLQLLRPLLTLLPDIPGAQRQALAAALLLGPVTDSQPSRFAVGAATLSLLSRAAEDQPIAAFVDDAHLLDSPSLDALVFAARRLVTDPVAIVVGLRPDAFEGSAGSAGPVDAPASVPRSTEGPWAVLPTMTLRGLDLDAAERLLVAAVDATVPPAQLARLHRDTAGNPLAMLELGSHLDELEALPPDAPPAVSDQLTRAFIGRVAELGPAASLALLVAAADGASVATVHRACALLDVPSAALAEAEDAGLVTVRDDELTFRHPLVRSAVYGTAAADSRRSVHRALARVLPAGESDRLAWHLSRSAAGPDETTAATLAAVGAQAANRGAYAISVNAYERSAELTADHSRVAVRLADAGEAAWLAGLTERSITLLDRALAAEPGAVVRARIQEVRGAVETRSGSLDSGVATLLAAAEEVRVTDPDAAIRLLADAVNACFYLVDPVTAMRAATAVEALLGSATDPRSRLLGSMASGMAQILSGAGGSGIAKVRKAAALAASDTTTRDHLRLPLRIQGTLWLRDSAPGHDVVRQEVDRMREKAALGSLPYLLFHIGRDEATTDRWGDAEAAYLEAIRLAAETGQSTDRGISLAGLACLYAREGRSQECRDTVAAAVELCRANHIRLGSCWADYALGDLRSGLGDPAGACPHYESLLRRLTEAGLADPDQSCAPELAEAYVHLGRTDDAVRVARDFEERARVKGQPWSLARAHRAWGLCGHEEERDRHFRTALELHAATSDRYETARTELAYGAQLRRGRRRVDARPFLRSALETFEHLGASPWADRAAQELDATGEPAARKEERMVDRLTPQERQIAQLLAQGRTTREAAAALFLSPKTVEYHLRHVYLKLDIRSRAGLAALFGD